MLFGGATALAATPVGGTGYDISNYQCSTPYPTGASFAVVQAVGAPNSPPNKCLQAQWNWATALPQVADLYVFAGNDSADPSTAYAHGYAAARSAVYNVACDNEFGNGNTGGLCLKNALQTVTPVRWWVDVEACSGYWSCPKGIGNGPANIAAIQGYVDALKAYPTRVSSIGLYGSPGEWKNITGGDATTLAALPYWYPDYNGDAAYAQATHCGTLGPNGGPIEMVQGNPAPAPGTGTSRIDGDARCSGGYGVVVTAPVPLAIVTSTDRQYAGRQITVTGTGPIGSTVTLSMLLATNNASLPLGSVVANATGHWTATVALQTSGTLVAATSDGAVSTRPAATIATTQILHAKKVANACAVIIDGNVRPWTVGQKVTIYGPKLKPIGTATTQRRANSPFGAWTARVNVPCGKVTALTPHISGVAKGNRYALDGAGPKFNARR